MKNAVFLTVLLIGLGLRLYKLDANPFGLDEMVSLHFSSQTDLRYLLQDTNPPLYHALLKAWLWVAPMDEFWARLPSVIFSVVSIVFVWMIGLRFLHGIWVFLPVSLIALSPLSITYAQEVRMYSLFEALSAASLFFLTRVFVDRERVKQWWIATSLAMLTHLYAVFNLAAGAGTLVSRDARDGKWRRIFSIILYLTLLTSTVVLLSKQDLSHMAWQEERFESQSLLAEVETTISSLFNGHSAFAALLILSGLIALIKRRFTLPAVEKLWWSFAIGSALILLVLSYGMNRSLFLPRYLIFLGPLLPLLLATQLMSLRLPRRWEIPIFVAVLGLAGHGLFKNRVIYFEDNQTWRNALLEIEKRPAAYVYTTRSETIKTPYLLKVAAKVERITPDDDHFSRMVQRARTGQEAFYVDNVYGARSYWEKLRIKLAQEGLIFEEKNFYWSSNRQTAVLLMYVHPDPPR